MTSSPIPDEVLALAAARQEARAAREWATADELRAEIEARGWIVTDQASSFRLRPAHPPDVVEGDRTRYGWSGSVPSRLGDHPVGLATVVLHAADEPVEVARAVDGLRRFAPAGTQVVVVEGSSPARKAPLDTDDGSAASDAEGLEVEVLRLSAQIGRAAALNAGIRRAAAPVVVLLDASWQPTGDLVTPLVDGLADPALAVCGAVGLLSRDGRRFEVAPPGVVDAIDLQCLAFRRADYVERGPLDEHFRLADDLGIWWSLVLRDEGEARVPRSALGLEGLPLVRHAPGDDDLAGPERARLARRSFYRRLDRFGHRRDLVGGPDTGPGP